LVRKGGCNETIVTKGRHVGSRTIGFIPSCLPTKAPRPPTGEAWLHGIKHGFRIVVRKDGARVRLYSRPGNDVTNRFTLIVEALGRLRSRSCIIDGEAVCCGDDGVPSFDRIRYRRHDASLFLYAFDLIEIDGEDLRRETFVRPLFAHACKMGLEGIVSKRKDSRYRSGRSPDWLKSKNPACEAVKREAEEDWGR
jgi:bifunctional non-homologous end joining protein LigD